MNGGDSSSAVSIASALSQLAAFASSSIGKKIGELEQSLMGKGADGCRIAGFDRGVDGGLLTAAADIKRFAGQINVTIHAVAIALMLPRILEHGETVSNISLGAGAGTKLYDLETDRRIAEFKFVTWQGGSETIRKNNLFIDFFELAEAKTTKRRELWVLGLKHPLKFLHGRRSISHVLSKNASAAAKFRAIHSDRFQRVCDYYHWCAERVSIRDARDYLPEMTPVTAADDVSATIAGQV